MRVEAEKMAFIDGQGCEMVGVVVRGDRRLDCCSLPSDVLENKV